MVFIFRRMQRLTLFPALLMTFGLFMLLSLYMERIQRVLLYDVLEERRYDDSPRRLNSRITRLPDSIQPAQEQKVVPQTPKSKITGPNTRFIFRNGKSFCNEKAGKASTILSVHSAPDHFENRRTIRETWGNPILSDRYKFTVFFISGTTTHDKVQSEMDKESKSHGDIVQYDYIDSYHNMTYKSLAELRFLADECSQSPFKQFLKVDDDMFIDPAFIVTFLEKEPGIKRTISCEHVRHNEPVLHDKGNKWYVPWEDYPFNTYPVYCPGTGYSFTRDLIVPLLQAAALVPYFWIDDAYITGMLAKEIGEVKHVQIPGHTSPVFIHTAQNLNEMKTLYNKFINVSLQPQQ